MPDLLSDDDRRLLEKGPRSRGPVTEIDADNVAVLEDLQIAIRRYIEAESPGMPSAGLGALRTLDSLLEDQKEWAGF